MRRQWTPPRICLVVGILLLGACAGWGKDQEPIRKVLAQSGNGWSFTFAYPAMTGFAAPVFNARVEAIARRSLAEFRKDIADFGPPPPQFKSTKSVLEAKYTLLSWGDIVSIKWDAYQMMAGGAHPVTQVITSNYLAGSGFIDLKDLFQPHSHWLQMISGIAKADVQKQARKAGFSLISPEGAGPDPKNFKAFGITKSGLRLFYQYAQVAPGAAGNLTTTIPWSDLRGVLKPEVSKRVGRL